MPASGHTMTFVAAEDFKFTGKARDAESGLDNFEARYLGSSLGRFMSPDPLAGHLKNPRSLSKYAYVLNNPLSLTDPTGLDSCLSCTQTKVNASTCQSQTVGYDKAGNAQTATVQRVTDKNGNFTATQIVNDANGNLVDKTTGSGSYTASVNGSGVHFFSSVLKKSQTRREQHYNVSDLSLGLGLKTASSIEAPEVSGKARTRATL